MKPLLNYILENAPAYIVQECVRDFNVASIGYKMKNSIINQFPEYRNCGTSFGIALAEQFAAFKTDHILAVENSRNIMRIQSKLRVYSRWHPTYKELVTEHDILVMLNNKLCEPINEFLKLYKKAQKAKGKNLRVVKKKETRFEKPAA